MIGIVIFALVLIYVFSKRADLISRAATFQYSRGNTEKALSTFKFAEKVGNLSAVNMMSYGYLLLRTGKLDEASTVLNLALMRAKKPVEKNRIKSIRALVTWKYGQIDDAVESLEELIENYKTTNMYQNLGLMYIIQGDKEKALEFNKEAYEYNDSDKIIVDNLAEAYFLNGDLQNAKETYEKLMELEPHFPEAYYGYGKLLIELGEVEQGKEQIKLSLDKPFTFLSVLKREEVEKELENI